MRWSVASADCFTPKRSLVRSQYRPLAQNAPDLQGQRHSLFPSGTRALNVPRDRTVSLLRTLVNHVPLGSCFTALRRRRRGQIQPVEAFASTSSVNISEGFFQSWILRGRS